MFKYDYAKRIVLISQAVLLFGCVQPALSQTDCKAFPDDPTGVPMASTAVSEWVGPISLYHCVVTSEVIQCSFNETRVTPPGVTPGPKKYYFDAGWLGQVTLRDNFHQEHSAVAAYFTNSKCQRLQSVSLDEGDSIWFNVEFSDPTNNITGVSIIMPRYTGTGGPIGQIELKGPAVKPAADAD